MEAGLNTMPTHSTPITQPHTSTAFRETAMRPTPPLLKSPADTETPSALEARLQRTVSAYLSAEDRAHLGEVLRYVHGLQTARKQDATAAGESNSHAGDRPRKRWDIGYVLSVAQALAETVHVD